MGSTTLQVTRKITAVTFVQSISTKAAKRAKHPTPSQAIDAHIGDEEQDGKQKRNKKLEEDLRAMVGHFIQVYRRRGLKVNSSKRKVMVLGGEEGLECEVWVDGMRLEHASEFKYLGCVLCESGTAEADCCRMVASGRRVTGVIRSLINAWGL